MPRARTGSVIPLPSGRFRVLQRLPDGTRKSVGICETEEEADALRRSTLRVLEREAPDGANTLRAYGLKWVRARTSRDQAGEEGRWMEHVDGDLLARMALRSIQPHHVEDFVERMWTKKSRVTGEQLASSTISNVVNLVRQCLRHAVKRRLMKFNPASDVRVGSRPRTEDVWHYLRPEQQRALIATSRNDFERNMIVFAMTSGVRAGELAALRIADVHEDHVVIRYGSVPDGPTKNGHVRTVYFASEAKEAIEACIAAIPTYTASKLFPHGHNPHGLAFPRPRGGFRDSDHVLAWPVWQGMIERAGLADRGLRWHDLRHTCGTSLACGWWGRVWTMLEIKDHLGHRQLSTTERYAKIAAEEVRRAAAQTTKGPSGRGNRSRSDHGSRSAARNPVLASSPHGVSHRCEDVRTIDQVGAREPMSVNALALLLAAARGDADEAVRLASLVAPGRTIREALDTAGALLESAAAPAAVGRDDARSS